MSNKKQNDVIQDITEQSLLTLDGVAEEITKQTVQEEVDNFIAERALKENAAEVMAIANKVKEYKKGDKTNFGVVVEVTPSSITFKAKDTPKTKIVFNQRKLGSKDYVLSSLSKMNESMEDMRSLEDIEPMEAEDMENMEVEEEETIESLAAKLELTDEQVATLAAKSNEKYEEEGDAKLLDMLKMVAMPTDEEHKSAMMELIVNGDFDALEAHIAEMMEMDKEESEDESEMMEMDKEESEDESEMMEMDKEESEEKSSKLKEIEAAIEELKANPADEIKDYLDALETLEARKKMLMKKEEESDMKVDTTDIEELVSSEEGLTEGFKEKASIIFEAAVASKVKETKSQLQEQYATRLNEEVEIVKETLVEKIDSYLTYAVETWVADNKVAVESTLRTEITESFIGSLKNLFTEHYIEVPESKVNIVADMEAQVSSLKEQVDKKGRIANALAERVEKLTRQKVIAEASAGLADTQIAKLTELVEDVEFINEDTFTKKVSTIREFYVNRRSDKNKNTLNENVDDNSSFISKETIVENQIEGDTISPSMQNYLSAMSRMNKATTANLVI
jgi:hypothetical protein